MSSEGDNTPPPAESPNPPNNTDEELWPEGSGRLPLHSPPPSDQPLDIDPNSYGPPSPMVPARSPQPPSTEARLNRAWVFFHEENGKLDCGYRFDTVQAFWRCFTSYPDCRLALAPPLALRLFAPPCSPSLPHGTCALLVPCIHLALYSLALFFFCVLFVGEHKSPFLLLHGVQPAARERFVPHVQRERGLPLCLRWAAVRPAWLLGAQLPRWEDPANARGGILTYRFTVEAAVEVSTPCITPSYP